MSQLNEYKSLFKNYLQTTVNSFYPESEIKLNQAIRYSLCSEGKMIRPLIVMASSQLVAGAIEKSLPAAMAVEMIHTYSLIHDDLPSMDNDDFRRGRPTNHKVFGEAIAILAGDALVTDSFYIMATNLQKLRLAPEVIIKMLSLLSSIAGSRGMVYGQTLDMEGGGQSALSLKKLEEIHRHKTGKLILGSFLLGAFSSERELDQNQEHLQELGEKIGLSFQIIDDILDEVASSEALGKTAGKDREQDKATYPKLMGLEDSAKLARKLLLDCGQLIGLVANTWKASNPAPLLEIVEFLQDRLDNHKQ